MTPAAEPRVVRDPALTAVLRWWEGNARPLPWRSSRDVYAIWVSEVMSVQTSVVRAAAAWTRWMERWPTVESLAAASLAQVLREWQGLGYPRRARDLHRAARIVVARGWPEDLTVLPGIGDYVAAAISCFAREEPVLPLDVNTRRVLARRFPGGVDLSEDPWRVGQALMEFGQRICTARPECGACPAREGCPLGAGSRNPTEGDRSLRTAHDPAPRTRRQARYEGSLRQRRGRLLRRVLTEGTVPLEGCDREAADGLLEDGLLTAEHGSLRVPE